ncbi:FG-GAP repeat protein [Haloferula helveola]|uniref:FG-GAP repeat protein n=1 Tax=Haloferula helveola TaxID=490095 RepID=A0ABN6GYJ2_9BACT|nr:FG-GAP repeat protein [Haloferula helveola]
MARIFNRLRKQGLGTLRALRFFSGCLPALGCASAITIEFDYTYDTNDWFEVGERKAILEQVASLYETILTDTLLRIDPADFPGSTWTVSVRNPQTGNTVSLPNFVVPDDTIVVFAGARELGGTVRGQAGNAGWSGSGFSSWFSRIRARGGNPGADYSSADAELITDYAPHVGFLSFDITTDYNYSTTQNLSGTDYVSVALHELGHVLGIGICDSWDNLINSGQFTGPASLRAAGVMPAVQSGNGHFDQSVTNKPAFGSFATPHGSSTPVLMRPSLTTSGGLLTVLTDLDLAALVDIGWQVEPPLGPTYPSLGPAGTQINWPSSSFRSYVVEKSTDLDFGSATTVAFDGDGSVQSWTDPSPPSGRCFYRMTDTAYPAPAAVTLPAPAMLAAAGDDEIRTETVAPRWVEGCECGGH